MSRTRTVSALALGLATILIVVGVAGAETWSDPAGDAQGGPDVTAVTVTNDPSGPITMSISVPPYGQPPNTPGIMVVLDVNRNGSDADSADRAIVIRGGWTGSLPAGVIYGAVSLPQNGSLMEAYLNSKVDVPSLKVTATTTAVELSFLPGEVGIDKEFGIWVGSVASWTSQRGQWSDRAPDSGYQTYRLTLPAPPPPPPPPVAVKPVIGTPIATPGQPTAGMRFTVTFPVKRSDDGEPLTAGTIICVPSVAGKAVAYSKSFKAGKARVSLAVPKGTKGKQLKVKVTVKSGGQSATKVATFKIH